MDHCDKLIVCAQVFQNESLIHKNQELYTLKTKLRRYEDPVILYESLDEYNNLYEQMKRYISTNINTYIKKHDDPYNRGDIPVPNDYEVTIVDEHFINYAKIITKGIYILTKNDYTSWIEEYLKKLKTALRSYLKTNIWNEINTCIPDFIINYITDDEGILSNMGYFKCVECQSITRIEYFISGNCDVCYEK